MSQKEKKKKENGQWYEQKLYETLNEIELVPRWFNVSNLPWEGDWKEQA